MDEHGGGAPDPSAVLEVVVNAERDDGMPLLVPLRKLFLLCVCAETNAATATTARFVILKYHTKETGPEWRKLVMKGWLQKTNNQEL